MWRNGTHPIGFRECFLDWAISTQSVTLEVAKADCPTLSDMLDVLDDEFPGGSKNFRSHMTTLPIAR